MEMTTEIFWKFATKNAGGIDRYESLKRLYRAAFPAATAEQYQIDMRRLASICGV